MALMGNSSYLANVFNNYRTVSIVTRNAKWRNDFYLPKVAATFDKVLKVKFDIQSSFGVEVHFESQKININTNGQMTFWNYDGIWSNKKRKNNFKLLISLSLGFDYLSLYIILKISNLYFRIHLAYLELRVSWCFQNTKGRSSMALGAARKRSSL